ncbi:type VI secretion system-associated protein TagF [Janthinobacterium agaricidamnosum]|uniref:Conserved hypothethical protein n=1 Tax=Janthinobacterium agaricidamnosum NBRC 102515 = DSM 9628 TaxID=1349767 RepID=W0V825_9BURK|nr:type VI secretion system-associated protein TagF [Janthinobacterium agaricidamnosum]CDG84031.1 conserved hypothethical protein [Janthinobacterium agaricidamnosum NBRC 102515 = DSM 9628]
MMRGPQQVRIGYFGKIPARSDFIKAADNIALVTLLDQWLAEVMNLLTSEPRWKLNYDAMAPLDFAFVGTRSKRSIAGRIVASSDQSQRRFPFMTMSVLEVAEPDGFLPCSPLVLAGLWQRLGRLSSGILAQDDPGPALHALAANVLEIAPGAPVHAAGFAGFLESQTLHGLQTMLASPGFPVTLRQLMLGLGMLLEPVRHSASQRLEKSLVLPLPRAPEARLLAASFWLHLIAPFLRHADFELVLFITDIKDDAVLVIGFCGADPHALQALIDPSAAAERQIVFDRLEWVEHQVAADPALQHLSACLAQDQLSLASAHALFCATFT